MYVHVHHVHIMTLTQAANINTICTAKPEVALAKCPEVEDVPQAVANKYGKTILLFSKCQISLNPSKHVEDTDISSLRKTHVYSTCFINT